MIGSTDDFDWRWGVLTPNFSIENFKCLTYNHHFENFLNLEALQYQNQHLSTTRVITIDNVVIAYFTLANDRISTDEIENPIRNRINRKIPHDKQRRGYPALKLCQLAVDDNYASNGFGSLIISKIIKDAYNFVGCRFITVDALPKARKFYKRMMFDYLCNIDESKIPEDEELDESTTKTYPMYFDLMSVRFKPRKAL
jgi:GNAT superfamily N-acetyltransferase